ncbi:MAG: hypothetical protein AB1531_04965 [Chloroflexota bacterium]
MVLDAYVEYVDGGLFFQVRLLNFSDTWFESGRIQVELYDEAGSLLAEKAAECDAPSIPSGSDCWLNVSFDVGEVPEGYAAYNIFAESATAEGEILAASLSNRPLSGQEGVTPLPEAHIQWVLPPDGYTAGQSLQAEFEAGLARGQQAVGQLCAQILEFRQPEKGQIYSVLLAETCQEQVVLQSLYGDDAARSPGDFVNEPYRFSLPFVPSGYTWISYEGQDSPAAVLACLTFDSQRVQPYSDAPLYLPPIRVIETWWDQNGEERDEYEPGQTYRANVRVQSLASDDRAHPISLHVIEDRRGLAGLMFFFPPLGGWCIAGVCDIEVKAESFELTPIEGNESTLAVEFVTETEYTGYPFYMAVSFHDVIVWAGEERLWPGQSHH